MSFKFNFSGHGDVVEDVKEEPSTGAVLAPATEIFHTEQIDTDVPFDEITLGEKTELKYVIASSVEQDLKQDNNNVTLQAALDSNSDLVPNIYEGGLKVWECSIDLADYLSSTDIAFRGLKVLELGCGAGLPGLFAFVHGAEVHFQDYNREVLERLTIPNVYLNAEDEQSGPSCRYFAGDWSLLQQMLQPLMKATSEKYDVILTSETIYSRDNYMKLHDLMKAVLKPSGVVYLAAKIHYFGVGGGLRDFESHVNDWGYFNVKTCHTLADGVQREILEMRFVQNM